MMVMSSLVFRQEHRTENQQHRTNEERGPDRQGLMSPSHDGVGFLLWVFGVVRRG